MNLPKRKFVYYITERESIRLIKEGGLPPPWSADPVFQTVYFCNNDRENDKVTRWIRNSYDLGVDDSIPNMILARFVNKIETLEKLAWPWSEWSHADFRQWHSTMSEPGAWGSAYVVSTNGHRMAKHEYVAGLLEQALERFAGPNSVALPPTLSGAHRALQAAPGMGSFMAAQVVADLKNTPDHPLYKAEDWMEFAAPGPGSLRGLSWFHGEKITPSKFTEALASARRWVYNSGHKGLIVNLCNQNLQNCFCEFDKYMRVSMGTGRSKRKYNGT